MPQRGVNRLMPHPVYYSIMACNDLLYIFFSFCCLDMKTEGFFQTLVLMYANNFVKYQQAVNFIFMDKRTSKKK